MPLRHVADDLFALPALMPRFGQQLAVLVLTHLFSSFLDYTAQTNTSLPRKPKVINWIINIH
jgi:hypothetical protein